MMDDALILALAAKAGSGGENLVHINSLPEEFQNIISAQQMQYAADVIAANGAMCSIPDVEWEREDATDKDAFDELAADLAQMELSEMGFIQGVFATKAGADAMRTIPFIYDVLDYTFNCMISISWGYNGSSSTTKVIGYKMYAALVTPLS